jgi:hypothetical protein
MVASGATLVAATGSEAMPDPSEPAGIVPIGGWSGVGAVLGLLFGLMLSTNLAVMIVVGTAIGLAVGLLIDRRRRSA